VRESVFMALEPFTGMCVVDLFAGTGALGIEALSRGAATVDFAEHDRSALAALKSNLATLGIEDRATIWTVDLERDLKRLKLPLAAADLVLLDPPYGSDAGARVLEGVAEPGILAPGTRVVVEHHLKDEPPEALGVLSLERRRRYGETVVSFYRAAEAGPGTEEIS
jgi:16S rRNA (guanine(966)-N(2))-methyltransferase RsmD